MVMASNFTAEKDARSCTENKDDGRSGKILNLIEEKLGEGIMILIVISYYMNYTEMLLYLILFTLFLSSISRTLSQYTCFPSVFFTSAIVCWNSSLLTPEMRVCYVRYLLLCYDFHKLFFLMTFSHVY